MVNNVIGVVNYVIAARPSLLNFMIADKRSYPRQEFRSLWAAGLRAGRLDLLGSAGARRFRQSLPGLT